MGKKVAMPSCPLRGRPARPQPGEALHEELSRVGVGRAGRLMRGPASPAPCAVRGSLPVALPAQPLPGLYSCLCLHGRCALTNLGVLSWDASPSPSGSPNRALGPCCVHRASAPALGCSCAFVGRVTRGLSPNWRGRAPPGLVPAGFQPHRVISACSGSKE